jgi:predicted ATPase
MRLVAEVLIDASRRTQIIVTTHSEALIDALSDTPESVMVCERGVDLGTQMKRLEKESLMDWLKDYTLGQLWRKGEIGGNSD